jgi:type III pantothenate kinase
VSPERVLLIGNSRWHWAALREGELVGWHDQPQGDGGPESSWPGLLAWAAVGPAGPGLGLPPERELRIEQVPLRQAPAWLGIDRALAGWWAWRQQGGGVLVADAGTALSLTRVDAAGCFVGGRISAGLALQLQALGSGTAQLPALATGELWGSLPSWPEPTAQAMARGCLQACVGAIARAWEELAQELAVEEEAQPWQLWLTGGDAELLAPELNRLGLAFRWAPDLCLEALAELAGLRPDRDP